MILTLFGPPGSGKGTQAGSLCKHFDLRHISTGDLLRAERASGSKLGREAESLMKEGSFVPDEMVALIARKEIADTTAQGRGILLDGYPRNLNQLRCLDDILEDLGVDLTLGLNLEIDDSKLLSRLASRRICSGCNAVYNLMTNPTKVPGICDRCGSKTYQRQDDRSEVIGHRLEEYHRQTMPILDALRERDRLKTVLADQSIESVRNKLASIVESWGMNGTGRIKLS